MSKLLNCTGLALAGSLLLFNSGAFAGPKEAYSDSCKYIYMSDGHSRCLTQRGRVLLQDGSLVGLLSKDYTGYRPPSRIRSYVSAGGYFTVRYEQVNQNRTLVEYTCDSNSSGSCTGETKKELYQYFPPN